MNEIITKKIYRHSKESKLTYELYENSFPTIEKVAYRLLHKRNIKGKVDFNAYYEGDKYIGFSFVMLTMKTAYLLFYATMPNERSKGYGSKILSELKAKYKDKNLVLDIEPVDEKAENNEQRKRRLAFYERNEFILSKYYMEDETGKFVILSTKENIDLEDLKTSFSIFPEMFVGTIIKN